MQLRRKVSFCVGSIEEIEAWEASMAARRVIPVTPAEVAAAKLRLVTDAKLGKKTPAVIRKIAEARPESENVATR